MRFPTCSLPKGKVLAQTDKSEAARQHAEDAADKANLWIFWIARIGYVAKGTVYAAVGVLAAQAAFGAGGKTTGASGAFESIGSQPLGKALLFLLAVGLVGYALWKLVQGIMDPDEKRRRPPGGRPTRRLRGERLDPCWSGFQRP